LKQSWNSSSIDNIALIRRNYFCRSWKVKPLIKNMSARILLVDDEEDILEFLKYNIENEGYEVRTATDGAEAVDVASSFIPNLIVMDVMMPGMDGIEACRRIRQVDSLKSAFVLFLTARNEEFSEIAAFEAGADDYVAKPIKPRALISRIKAILKRKSDGSDVEEIIQVGDLIINSNTYEVKVDGEVKILPKKEFELLRLMARKPGKVYSREKILNKVWGTQVFVGDRTIDVHIRKIREKIGENKIETIKGVGYKFKG
jgi:two-component system alkaline phosphatase synthesis response regulator PhoP